jgi:hypothetical protein
MPLLLPDADWTALRARAASTELNRRLAGQVVASARALLDEPPLVRALRGFRMLDVSRAAVARTLRLGLAFRLSEDERIAKRFAAEAAALVAFIDYNPPHWLDVAEMATALGVGLDWFGDTLPTSERQAIVAALRDKVLVAATEEQWWWASTNNWAAVCFAGVAVAARAVLRAGPDPLAGHLLEKVLARASNAFACYEPDGVYPEGPTYWSYGTIYAAILLEALENSGHANAEASFAGEGFARSAAYRAACDGPSGALFNYSDTHSRRSYVDPALFWFARRLGSPELLDLQRRLLDEPALPTAARPTISQNFLPMVLAWMPNDLPIGGVEATSWAGRGAMAMAVHRRPDAGLYVAVKAGGGDLPHAHLDAGSFVLDLGGQRFACDLGSEDYYAVEKHMKDLFESHPNAGRWKLLRYQNRAHNTLTIGHANHDATGHARLLSHGADETIIDLGPPLGCAATRRVRVEADAVRIDDEIIEPAGDVTWSLVTEATVEPTPDGFVLHRDGVTAELQVANADDARLDARPLDDYRTEIDSPNPGVTLVTLRRPRAERVAFAVTFRCRGGAVSS